MFYMNKKTGKFYLYRHTGRDATNERDGLIVVIYSSLDNPDGYYVREQQEFNEKFIPVKVTEVTPR